jgi:hypothetical protein
MLSYPSYSIKLTKLKIIISQDLRYIPSHDRSNAYSADEKINKTKSTIMKTSSS